MILRNWCTAILIARSLNQQRGLHRKGDDSHGPQDSTRDAMWKKGYERLIVFIECTFQRSRVEAVSCFHPPNAVLVTIPLCPTPIISRLTANEHSRDKILGFGAVALRSGLATWKQRLGRKRKLT